jgi:hypothetical protein
MKYAEQGGQGNIKTTTGGIEMKAEKMEKNEVSKHITREQKDARQAACNHESRASKMPYHSAFRQISISPQGVSLMKCTKCGLEKKVAVNAIYLTGRERDAGRKPHYEGTGRKRPAVVEKAREIIKGAVAVMASLGLKKETAKA